MLKKLKSLINIIKFIFHKKNLITINSSSESYSKSIKEEFYKTDLFFLLLIFIHWCLSLFIIPLDYESSSFGLVFGTPLLVLGILSYLILRGTNYNQIINSLIFSFFSIIFITQQLGRIEMHFHFFVTMAFLSIYRKKSPIISVAIVAILHSIIFNYLQIYRVEVFKIPIVAFRYGFGLEIVLWHIFWIIFTSIVLLIIAIRDINQVKTNITLFKLIDKQNDSINHFLKISKQGIFTFGKDLKILDGYSLECTRIFGINNLKGKYFPELLYDSVYKQNELRDTFELVFIHNVNIEEIYSLIEKEFKINDKYLQVNFLPLDIETIFCTLIDITEQKNLTVVMEKEKQNQDRIYRFISNQKYFKSYLHNSRQLFIDFSYIINKFISKNNNFEEVKVFLEHITLKTHDFKANSGFFGNQESMHKAHELEDFLIDLRIKKDVTSLKLLKEKVMELKNAFDQDLLFVKNYLGEEWFDEEEVLTISELRFKDFEDYILEKYSHDRSVLNKLKLFRAIPVAQIFDRYRYLLQDLAKLLSKKVEPLSINGNEILVPKDQFMLLGDVLIHVFRNILYHGIEEPSERKWFNKSEKGKVTVNVENFESNDKKYYKIIISDDGKGIDYKKIASIAFKKGIINSKKVTKKELGNILMNYEISTSTSVNQISGRGAGFSECYKRN